MPVQSARRDGVHVREVKAVAGAELVTSVVKGPGNGQDEAGVCWGPHRVRCGRRPWSTVEAPSKERYFVGLMNV